MEINSNPWDFWILCYFYRKVTCYIGFALDFTVYYSRLACESVGAGIVFLSLNVFFTGDF